MYKDTLIFMTSDNGGNQGGGNNWPLRGAKFSNWEGGIRVPAFVSGGALPEARRGIKLSGIAGIEDFYATFCDIAGVDSHDAAAAAAKLPPVDSVNQWPYWSGSTIGPRTEYVLGRGGTGPAAEKVEGLIKLINGSVYKLLRGVIGEAVWTGPKFPNQTKA